MTLESDEGLCFGSSICEWSNLNSAVPPPPPPKWQGGDWDYIGHVLKAPNRVPGLK